MCTFLPVSTGILRKSGVRRGKQRFDGLRPLRNYGPQKIQFTRIKRPKLYRRLNLEKRRFESSGVEKRYTRRLFSFFFPFLHFSPRPFFLPFLIAFTTFQGRHEHMLLHKAYPFCKLNAARITWWNFINMSRVRRSLAQLKSRTEDQHNTESMRQAGKHMSTAGMLSYGCDTW